VKRRIDSVCSLYTGLFDTIGLLLPLVGVFYCVVVVVGVLVVLAVVVPTVVFAYDDG
jgi:hypothetical protein